MTIVRRAALRRANAESEWYEYTRVRSSNLLKVEPGVWLPTQYSYETINIPSDGSEPKLAWRYEGRASNWQVHESFDDDLFTISFDDDVEVNDHRIDTVAARQAAENEEDVETNGEAESSDTADEEQVAEVAQQPASGREPLYDPEADAQQQIAAAVSRAKRDGKHVIVKFGGNWCGWCYRLHSFLHDDEALATLLEENYELVMVDVNSNRDLFLGYGSENEKHGFPFLTVLNGDGSVLTNQNTADLEEGDSYNTATVARFLSFWQPERLDALTVLQQAKVRASEEDKRLFLHFGAPWCGWCHRLDAFLEKHAERFGKDFVDVKIDIERMRHGNEVAAQFREGLTGGIPWFAILDADGTVVATADGPEGNVGFPVREHEIKHFMELLRETATEMDEADLAAIEADLRAAGE